MLEHTSAKLCKYFTLIELADSIGFPRPQMSPRLSQSNPGCVDLRTGQNSHPEGPNRMCETQPLRLVS